MRGAERRTEPGREGRGETLAAIPRLGTGSYGGGFVTGSNVVSLAISQHEARSTVPEAGVSRVWWFGLTICVDGIESVGSAIGLLEDLVRAII